MAGIATVPVKVELHPAIKPGTQTTEYWTTVLTHLVAGVVLLMSVVLHKQFIDQQAINGLIPVGATVMAGGSQIAYVLSRAKVKAAAHLAIAQQAVTVTQQVDPALSAEFTSAVTQLRSFGAQVEQLLHPPVRAAGPNDEATTTL